jgi:hypothetical protein
MRKRLRTSPEPTVAVLPHGSGDGGEDLSDDGRED